MRLPVTLSVTTLKNWWPWFRLGEIYLNAAEAAFELNDEPTALPYINRLRQRAGFPANSLTSLTIEKDSERNVVWNWLSKITVILI